MTQCNSSCAAGDEAQARLPLAAVEDAATGGFAAANRRGLQDRRGRVWWAVAYGSFNPRRRKPPRREADSGFYSLDWHSAHLLAVAIGILLLSVADAFLTVTLLAGGAVELNPLMAALVERSAALFALLKMSMTGCGVVVMVALSRYRFMRLVRVDVAMYAVMLTYLTLLTYEFWMLRHLFDPAYL